MTRAWTWLFPLLLASAGCVASGLPATAERGDGPTIERVDAKAALIADGRLKAVVKTVHVPGHYQTRTVQVAYTVSTTTYQNRCTYSMGKSNCSMVSVPGTRTAYRTETRRSWVPPRTYQVTVYRKRAVLLEDEVEVKARPRFPRR